MFKRTIVAILAAGGLLVTGIARADAHCEPSRWGADDEIGNVNMLDAAAVLKASKLITEGKTYSLGITIDTTTPAFAPRGLSLQIVQPGQQESARPMMGVTYNDDVFQGWFGIGSQLDGLSHLGYEGEYYNCNKAQDFAQIAGVTKLGIEKVPPIVSRGIVLNMAAHKGKAYLDAGEYFTVADVQAVEKAQGTAVQAGDVVLFHTGWTDAKLGTDPQAWVSGEPGIEPEVASYLASKDVVAVGADTWGLDVLPAKDPAKPFAGHVILLKENGIYILETMNTGPLVRDGVHEFMFVLGHAKVRGAVQMMINPIAIR